MKLNTRDKKPKLYDILALTVLVAAALSFAIMRGYRNWLTVSIVLDVYFLAALVCLVRALIRQIQYNLYSYNTIFYIGYALFILSVLIAHIVVTVNIARYPDVYNEYQILTVLMHSAQNYIILSLPFILLFSIGLFVSNIFLIRHEGKSFANVLGIILSFVLVGGVVFLYANEMYVSGSQREVMFHEFIFNTYAAIYLYFECMIIGAIAADVMAARHEPEKDKDYLIVLGCGLNRDGTPTPLLKGRCDRALKFYHDQKKQTGRELTIITSGGQGPDEAVSEAQAMKDYLVSKGVTDDRIVMEDQSGNTFENMKFSKAKIDALGNTDKIAFATTNYHVFRSGIFARRVKMKAEGMGADTKWYFWPNAAVREFVGLLTKHKRKQTAILVSMIIIYLVLTLVVYG